MRVPLSWLAEYVELPEDISAAQVADALVGIGIEVEGVLALGPVSGPLVVGRVAEIEELSGLKKPIRYCQVQVGEEKPRGIVCGATNFTAGDLVVVALPGTVLPGDFAISARRTYGRTSDGMICSVRELGLGEDHAGILVLPAGTAEPGTEAAELLGLADTVFDLEITPDRGYALSVRGLARELACVLDRTYRDPAAVRQVPAADGEAHPVRLDDPVGCRRFVARRVDGVAVGSASPWWIQRRLLLSGMRPISLAVDVTNLVMLELGQPLHAFDAAAVRGALVVRRAAPGEQLATLDGSRRDLDPADIVIADDSGVISLAAVMGGASTEIGESTTDVLIEAASWDPPSVGRTARRHKLFSEAARRFEREVDPALPPVAAERAAALLTDYGGGRVLPGRTDVGAVRGPATVVMALDLPDRIAGVRYARGVTARRLEQIGATVEVATGDDGAGALRVTPPTWRPDLTQPADLVEEVLRLEGFDKIPSVLPPAPPGRGLSLAQRRNRAVARALADDGFVQVIPSPFVAASVWDDLRLGPQDPRRRTMSVVNPLDADRPELATTLLPGLLEVLARNVARGIRDVALYAVGQVILPSARQVPVPTVGVAHRPEPGELAALQAAVPMQPLHVAAVLTGNRELPGWWGVGRTAGWADAAQAAQLVARVSGVELRVVAADLAPWHPGRCAQLRVGDWPVGHAGELHPEVIEALRLPPRTCAMELDLDALPLSEHRPAPRISTYPPVLQDVALMVRDDVPTATVAEALRAGAGDLLEDLRLFDVYTGDQLPEGTRSLAFSMRFRAGDRTLTAEEAATAREAAVEVATQRHGATLRA